MGMSGNTQNLKVSGIQYGHGCTRQQANWNPISAINRLTCRAHVSARQGLTAFRYLTAGNHRRCVGVYLRLYFMFSLAPCRMQTIASLTASQILAEILLLAILTSSHRAGGKKNSAPSMKPTIVTEVSAELQMRYYQPLSSEVLPLSHSQLPQMDVSDIRFPQYSFPQTLYCLVILKLYQLSIT